MRSKAMLTLFALLTTTAATAQADWVRLQGPNGSGTLLDLSAPDASHVFVGGVSMESTGGMFPEIKPVLLASSQGGRSFSDITPPVSGGLFSFASVDSLFFLNAERGWAGVGEAVYQTSDAGETWTSATIATTTGDIRFFDAQNGILAGDEGLILRTADGGQSWTPAESGTDIDLTMMFWTDRQHGWVCGQQTEEITDPESGATQTQAAGGVVLATEDGGATWTTRWTTTGYYLGPLHFLHDNSHGWLALTQVGSDDRATASLYRSSDGGRTFADTALPVQVGEVNMFMKIPVNLGYVAAMYWSDEQNGHLGGSAFLISSSDGQGGEKKIYRNADFRTIDGGASWQKTDLGSIAISFGGESMDMPASDGIMTAGTLLGLNSGWMAGEGNAIYMYQQACTFLTDCGVGEQCKDGYCTVGAPSSPTGCTQNNECPTGTVCQVATGDCLLPPPTDSDTTKPGEPDSGSGPAPSPDGTILPGSDALGPGVGDVPIGGATESSSGANSGCNAATAGCNVALLGLCGCWLAWQIRRSGIAAGARRRLFVVHRRHDVRRHQ